MNGRYGILAALIALGMGFGEYAQAEYNCIRTDMMLDSSSVSRQSTVRYYDGLGRLEQVVAAGASPSGADFVMLNSRDRAGRIVREYNAVPFSGSGQYVQPAEVETLAVTAYGDANPYSFIEYEQSPLGRLIATTGPGVAWHSAGKAVRKTYLANSVTDKELRCRKFSVTDTRNISDTAVTVTPKGFYAKGALFVTKTEDEDGHTSLSFADSQGKTVLTRTLLDNGFADTYYVYDIAGNLTVVLPPVLSAALGDEALSSSAIDARSYAYFYIYDWQGHCRAKKLPGCSWQIAVLDKSGKTIMKQDGNMRESGVAEFCLTDVFGRECVKGICPQSLHLEAAGIDTYVRVERGADTDSLGGYAVKDGAISLPGDNLLKVTYYDDYGFLDGKTFASELAYRNAAGYDSWYQNADYPSMSTRGMLTGAATRILNDSTMLYSAVYYDHHGNVIQTHEQNAVGGYDHYYYRLTFTGKPLAVRHEHSTAESCNVQVCCYTYDSSERLHSVTLSLNDGKPVELAANSYDEFGRLQRQVLGGNAQGVVRYDYNVRGWITEISNRQFSQMMYYEASYAGAVPCYNGDISAIVWEAKDDITASTTVRQAYRFAYDGFDRLTSAGYSFLSSFGTETGITSLNDRDYSCTYTYDLNSNVSSLRRKGVSNVVTSQGKAFWTFGDIDKLSLSYNGNQLKKVEDQADGLTYAGAMDFKDNADKATEYTYDANGNMTCDRNKKIHSIAYNILNLPSEITFTDGHIIRYTYDADGTKLKTEYLLSNLHIVDPEIGGPMVASLSDGILTPSLPDISIKPTTLMTLEYCAGHVYRNGELERINNDYGYWADSTYHYHIKDYQDNVRAVIDEYGTLEEVNSYYPYGSLMVSANAGVQPYKYGAKELDRENGLDLYDSNARYYDPLLGRTTTQDPLSERYHALSPYLWCTGNPIKFIDPKGEKVELYVTSLPGCEIPLASHTFIVVRDEQNIVRGYYSYGSEYDDARGAFSGSLQKKQYMQDQMVYKSKDKKHLKKIITIQPPKGMDSSEFDDKVMSVAESFGNNSSITYFIAPTTTDLTKGNCNTSTSTILLKSGITPDQIKQIKKDIPGISWGFSPIARPWTEQEQKDAICNRRQADMLFNIIGRP